MDFDEAAQAAIDAFVALTRAGRSGLGSVHERRHRLEIFEQFLDDKLSEAAGEQIRAIVGPLAAAYGYDIEIEFPGDVPRITLVTFTKLVASEWSDEEEVGQLELDFKLTLTDLTTDQAARDDLVTTVAEFLADGKLAEGDRCTDAKQRS